MYFYQSIEHKLKVKTYFIIGGKICLQKRIKRNRKGSSNAIILHLDGDKKVCQKGIKLL